VAASARRYAGGWCGPTVVVTGATASDQRPGAGTTSPLAHRPAGRATLHPRIHATGYRSRLWTMRMFAASALPRTTNARFRSLLAAGQTALDRLRHPTLYGFTTRTDPEAEGDRRRCRVSAASPTWRSFLRPCRSTGSRLDDDQLAGRPDLGDVHRRRGEGRFSAGDPRGDTTQNDILKGIVAQKEFCSHAEPSMLLVTDTIEFGTRELPKWKTVSISGYHIREPARRRSRSSPSRSPTDGLCRGGDRARSPGRDFAPRLSFSQLPLRLLEEIAKFRPRAGSGTSLCPSANAPRRALDLDAVHTKPPACR